LKEIEKGIIVFDNPYGGSNITTLTTSEGTLIIDSSLFPSKAAEVALYIKRLLKSEIVWITNTHYHPDHTFGNSGIKAQLLTSEKTEKYFSIMNRHYIDQVIEKEEALKEENINEAYLKMMHVSEVSDQENEEITKILDTLKPDDLEEGEELDV